MEDAAGARSCSVGRATVPRRTRRLFKAQQSGVAFGCTTPRAALVVHDAPGWVVADGVLDQQRTFLLGHAPRGTFDATELVTASRMASRSPPVATMLPRTLRDSDTTSIEIASDQLLLGPDQQSVRIVEVLGRRPEGDGHGEDHDPLVPICSRTRIHSVRRTVWFKWAWQACSWPRNSAVTPRAGFEDVHQPAPDG